MWKIVGGLTGFFIYNFVGLILGVVIGAIFDSRRGFKRYINRAPVGEQQQVFFNTLFLLLGRLAKSDGLVTPEEIRLASHVMDNMSLMGESRKQAIELFNQGKNASFELTELLDDFQNIVGAQSGLRYALVELLLASAYADDNFSEQEKVFTAQVCALLDIEVGKFQRIHARIEQQARFRQYRQNHQQTSEKKLLTAAYGTIGVNAEMSDDEIKKAYRKLMSKNHPDKLMSQGVPEEMVEFAKQRTQEIQSAYELIKKTRKEMT